ncbi:MAG: hypothetical protein ACLFU5_01325, partial [Thermoplasmata archaeon]
RLMVIPIVAMLAVTMVVAGWQQGEEQLQIEVDEGYDEMEIEYLDYGSNIPADPDEVVANGTTVSEILDDKGELELYAEVDTQAAAGEMHYIYVYLTADGEFDENLSPDHFKFTARRLPASNIGANHINFRGTDTEIEGGTMLPWSEQDSGARGEDTASVEFDVEENSFSAQSRLTWDIPFGNEENYTLEIQAVTEGLSQEVTATIYLDIIVPKGGVN